MSAIQNRTVQDPSSTDPWGTGYDGTQNVDQGMEDSVGITEGQDSSFGNNSYDLTRAQALDLFYKADAKVRAGEADTSLLQITREVLSNLAGGNKTAALQEYTQALDLMGGQNNSDPISGDPQLDSVLTGQNETGGNGDAPADGSSASVDNGSSSDGSTEGGVDQAAPRVDEEGVKHYEASVPNQDFDINGAGDESTSIVDTSGPVTFTPKDLMHDKIYLYQEPGYNVLKVTNNDNVEIIKVNDKAELHLTVDPSQVSGNVDSKKIKIGNADEGENYISDEKVQNFARDLETGSHSIGDGDFGINGYKWGDGGFNEKKNGSAIQILWLMSNAVKEKDPDKKKENWDKATEELSGLLDSDMGGNHINDIGQLMFDMTHKGGENLFKEALEGNLIPKDFIQLWAQVLRADSSESTSGDYKNVDNNIGWTHERSAKFLESHGGVSSSPSTTSSNPNDSTATGTSPTSSTPTSDTAPLSTGSSS